MPYMYVYAPTQSYMYVCAPTDCTHRMYPPVHTQIVHMNMYRLNNTVKDLNENVVTTIFKIRSRPL